MFEADGDETTQAVQAEAERIMDTLGLSSVIIIATHREGNGTSMHVGHCGCPYQKIGTLEMAKAYLMSDAFDQNSE